MLQVWILGKEVGIMLRGLMIQICLYAKADILIDSETMLVHDFVLRMKPGHDVIGAKTVFQRLKHKNQGILILGDKGYDSEKLHKLVNSLGNIFCAPVRNKSKKPKGFYRLRARKKR